MSGIIQLSEAASLALHAMVLLAGDPEKFWLIRDIAVEVGASEAHLAKVVQRLSKSGLLLTVRGPKGGVFLARPANQITYSEIFEAIEGPISAQKCVFEKGTCPFKRCIFGGLMDRLAIQIREKFMQTRLSDFWDSGQEWNMDAQEQGALTCEEGVCSEGCKKNHKNQRG